MEDSFIVTNFHYLCRLCLNKSSVMVSLYGTATDDFHGSLVSKIADHVELQIDPNDGLPAHMCYKCLYKLDKCVKFRLQCVRSETRLREIVNRINDLDNSNSSELSSYNYNNSLESSHKVKNEDYIVEDSVVMVVDPGLDCDSEESENVEQADKECADRDNTPDGEPMSDSFLKNVFMCQFCDQAFICQEKCSLHEQSYHNPNLPYNCAECSLLFAERTQYIQHTKQVHGNHKPYNCPECDKCFSRRSDLRKHSIVHTGVRPYQCHFCLKSFSRNTNLSKHLRIHAGRKPHVCQLCPRSFVAKGDLDRHVLIHSGMRPYKCQRCPLTFSRRDKLKKHELRHPQYVKEHESVTGQNGQDMVVNVNPYSNIISPPNTQAVYDLPSVPDHISGEGSFANQAQKNSPTSKLYQNSPAKIKPSVSNKNKPKNIKCHQCPKRFSSLDSYKTHISIVHMGSRPVFPCKICFKKFGRKRELDRHSALHTGIKPFSCNQCDKKFSRKDKLLKHERTSHDCMVMNLPCVECGMTFEKKSDLVSHIKSHFTDNFEEKSSETDLKKEEPEFSLDDNLYDLET